MFQRFHCGVLVILLAGAASNISSNHLSLSFFVRIKQHTFFSYLSYKDLDMICMHLLLSTSSQWI